MAKVVIRKVTLEGGRVVQVAFVREEDGSFRCHSEGLPSIRIRGESDGHRVEWGTDRGNRGRIVGGDPSKVFAAAVRTYWGDGASTIALRFPLTKGAVCKAFDLNIDPRLIEVKTTKEHQDVVVTGEWKLSRLDRVFKAAGFARVKEEKDAILYCSPDDAIGVQCFGVTSDQKINRFATYSFELQARSLRAVAKGERQALRIW